MQTPTSTPTTMTKSEYARHRGVSAAMVSKYVREDRILVMPDGRVDVEISDTLLNQFSESPLRNPQTNSSAPDDFLSDDIKSQISQLSDIGSYAEHRARLTKYKADQEEIKLREARKLSTPTDRVINAAQTTGTRVRDALLNLRDQLPPVLATMTDTHEIWLRLDKDFRAVLNELYNEFLQKPNPNPRSS